mgnify:CR=1 FL=1
MPILSSEEFRALENDNLIFKDYDAGDSIRESINRNTSISFGNQNISDVVESSLNGNGYVGYLEKDNKIVASGFGKKEISNGEYDTMYIHTFSVNEEYRGMGLCQKIVNEFIKKFGKKYILYLTVRTESGNENISAIKCYEKNGFIMLPSVYRDHYDGKNNAMIRVPNIKKNTRKKNRKTRIKRK